MDKTALELDEARTRLRRGLLLIEREKTRVQGRRALEKLYETRSADLSPIAGCGLASSYFWANDFTKAMNWAQATMAQYPHTTSAVWCASFLIAVYRMLGMKKERFEMERERILMMKRMAFQSQSRDDRAFALEELMRELEARDLPEDAKKYADELEDLRS